LDTAVKLKGIFGLNTKLCPQHLWQQWHAVNLSKKKKIFNLTCSSICKSKQKWCLQ